MLVEALEQRVVLSLTPITTIDPSRFGLAAIGNSSSLSVSDDGQIVAFQSDASDIVSNDLNGRNDVFVYFRNSGRVELVSTNSAGLSGDGESTAPRVSPDGRYVMFETTSGDIVPGASGFAPQLAARDLQLDTTIVISADDSGVPGNRPSQNGFWSGDSTKVVFESAATNFSNLDTNGAIQDIFLRDLSVNTTTLISVNRDGTGSGNNRSLNAQISRDGNHVVFESFAEDLIANDLTNIEDVYVRDLTTNSTELITIDNTGTKQPTVHSGLNDNAISADGRYVMFVTSDGNFGDIPTFNGNNLYLRDRSNGTTELISVNAAGNAGVGGFSGMITPDGQYVTFISSGAGIDPAINDTNNTFDAFRRNRVTGVTELVTVNLAGDNGGDGLTVVPMISDDGRFISFFSEAGNLSADPDGNQTQDSELRRRDVFVRDMQMGITTNVSSGGNNYSQLYVVTPDFQILAFETLADNLVAGDRNVRQDVVIRDLATSTTALMSRRDPSFPAVVLGGGGGFSSTPDGRYVAFTGAPSADYAPGVTFTGFQTGVPYVRDRLTGELTVVDLTPDPNVSGGGFSPILTPDGRYVAFWSRVPTGGSDPLVGGIDFTVGDFFFGRDVYLRDLATGTTQLISVDPTGTTSNNGQGVVPFLEHAVSDDGRYVVFTSHSDNLVAGLSNPSRASAIYLRDTWTSETVLVSHNLANDGLISGQSYNLSMTPDGRYVSFVSEADDLVDDDANSKPDVFRWDRTTGLVTLVSVNEAGTGTGSDDSGGAAGFRPVMTPDGKRIAFASRASDLVADDSNNHGDVFVRDLVSGTTQLVSINAAGTAGGNQDSLYASISDDGNKVAFISRATDLTAGTSAFIDQAYVRNLQTGVTELVSIGFDGSTAGDDRVVATSGARNGPTISPDGNYVAFQSEATNLVDGFVDANGPNEQDVFVRDLSRGITQLITYNQSGTAGGNDASVSSRYQFVGNDPIELIFDSAAGDLFAGDRNATSDVFAVRIVGTAQIAGTVFADVDRDGTLNGETGIPGVAVYLDDNGNGRPDRGESRRITDADGRYAFNNLGVGEYQLGVLLPNGLEPTDTETRIVDVTAQTPSIIDQEFGAARAITDLAVTSVISSEAAIVGRSLAVTWAVQNLGDSPVNGPRQDAVYVSRDSTLDASDRLVHLQTREESLGPGESYSVSANVTVPPVDEGPYFVIAVTDRRREVSSDVNRSNNVLSAVEATVLTVPRIQIGEFVSDVFSPGGGSHYFRFDVDQYSEVALRLNDDSRSGIKIFAKRDSIPTEWAFDVRGQDTSLGQRLVFEADPGTYYISVVSDALADTSSDSPYSLHLNLASFVVESIDLDEGDRGGDVTIRVLGEQLSRHAKIELTDDTGARFEATRVWQQSRSEVYATFDLRQIPVGTYDLRVSRDFVDFQPGVSSNEPPEVVTQTIESRLENAFRVVEGTPDATTIDVTTSAFARVLGPYTTMVTFRNLGTHDVAAPLLEVTTDPRVRLFPIRPGAPSQVGSMLILAASDVGPADVIRPGQSVSIRINGFAPPTTGELTTTVRPVRIDDEAVDFTAFVQSIGGDPLNEPWTSALQALTDQYGTTWRTLYDGLRQVAYRTSGFGQFQNTVAELLLHTTFESVSDSANANASSRESTEFVTSESQLPASNQSQSQAEGEENPICGGSGTNLTFDELFCRENYLTNLASAFNQVGAPNGAVHLISFLLPDGVNTRSGPDMEYGIGDPLSEKAKNQTTGGVWTYPLLHETVVEPGVKSLIESLAQSEGDASEIIGQSVDVRPLNFYDQLANVTLGIKFFNAAGIDLQLAFGAMQKGKFTFKEADIPKKQKCEGRRADYSAKIEYEFEDRYDFGGNDLTGGFLGVFFNGMAAELQNNIPAWALGFDTKLMMEEMIEGQVYLSPKSDDNDECDPDPPDPPDDDDGPGGSGGTDVVGSFDPNDIRGPSGVGPERWLRSPVAMPYTIRFENDPVFATAPAREVLISHSIDEDLDWESFELGNVGFGTQVIAVPTGLQQYETVVDFANVDGSPLQVQFSAEFDRSSGTVTWAFQSLDPQTGLPPGGIFDGFLPPNDVDGNGEGFVDYVIHSRTGLPSGTTIDQQASIVFDTNEVILTNVYTNTIDAGTPESMVNPLPAVSADETFTVSWSGTDDVGGTSGVGIDTFDVFVSTNGGPFDPFLAQTRLTSAEFSGEPGNVYAFYSVATDLLGHRQPTPDSAQTVTTVAGGFDFGDAPDGIEVDGVLRRYETLASGGAARHAIGSSLVLGATVDVEDDGQPSLLADGDGVDEDGVVAIASIVATDTAATTSSFRVSSSAAGKLDVWIDFDHDGVFSHPQEHLASGTSIDVVAGENIIPFSVPAGTLANATFARFRLSTSGGLAPGGEASDGEVEDYRVELLDGNLGANPVLNMIVGDVEVIADAGQVVIRHGGVDVFRAAGTALAGETFLGTDDDDVVSLGNLGSALTSAIPIIYSGGAGSDTLRLKDSEQTLDLTDAVLNQLTDIEVIDIVGASPNVLILDGPSVVRSTDAQNSLVVVHDEDDTVDYIGENWVVQQPVFINGQQRHVLTNVDATVQTVNTRFWTNPLQATDVNFSGATTAADALEIINLLARKGSSAVDLPVPTSGDDVADRYFDVNGSLTATALDALRVINFLGRQQVISEGEAISDAPMNSSPDLRVSPPLAMAEGRNDAAHFGGQLSAATNEDALPRAAGRSIPQPQTNALADTSLDLGFVEQEQNGSRTDFDSIDRSLEELTDELSLLVDSTNIDGVK